jgi:CRP/FNR family transcriptional regulator, cyclic AMP receptor protein
VLSGGRTITEVGEHDVFGELAVLDPEPRSASIEALVDTHLFKLSHAQVDDLMASNMEIVRGFVRMLCGRLRESTRRVNSVSQSRASTI